MKTELTIISDDLNYGIIDEKEARTLLLSLLGAVRSLPSDDFLKKLFQNNSDCYADTWSQDGLGAPMVEGELIQAITLEQFIKVVKSIWQ